MDGIRYANIGIGVAGVILLLAVIFFRDAPEGFMAAAGLLALVAALVVHNVLYERAKRRSKRPQ